MTATINTDASHRPGMNLGGYAFWISTDKQRYKSSGLLKGKIIDSTEAELKAVANAFHHLIVNIKPEGLEKVYVNTDCMAVKNLIDSKKKCSNSGKYKEVLALIQKLIKGLDVEIRHVKGHKHTNTPRNYVNDWCDNAARQAINNSIKQTKDGNN